MQYTRPFIPFFRDVQLDDTIYFGKHKGKKLWQVIEGDKGWIAWARETITNFHLSEEAHNYILSHETNKLHTR